MATINTIYTLINDPYDLHDFIEGELTIAFF